MFRINVPLRLIAVALLAVFTSASLSGASEPDEIIVSRTDDPIPPPVCTEGNCSFRSAVILSNSTPGPQSILLPEGQYALNLGGPPEQWYEDSGLTGDIDITDDVSIIGGGTTVTILESGGGQAERALDAHEADVWLLDLTIRNLFAVAPLDCGKAIRSSGTLSLSRVDLLNNVMRGDGGAICNEGGQATIVDSRISGNCACFFGSGGAIFSTGALSLDKVELSSNHADSGDGGAVYADQIQVTNSAIVNNRTTSPDGARRGGGVSAEAISVTNVTLTNNRAGLSELGVTPTDSRGGAVFVGMTGTFLNVTVTDNQSGLLGGGIAVDTGALATISNSIVGNNGGGDCLGDVDSGGYNTAGDDTCGLLGTADSNSTAVVLTPLIRINETYARVPVVGDSVIDSAENASCPTVDQRSAHRPADGNGDGRSICDRGSVEITLSDIGDVNCDSTVSAIDALLLLHALAELNASDCISAGDVNQDDLVSPLDSLAILTLL